MTDQFLSTPPSRVATRGRTACRRTRRMFLSTPPSRVATLGQPINPEKPPVSIHATLAGGDTQWRAMAGELKVLFLSTPPSRVATPPMRRITN